MQGLKKETNSNEFFPWNILMISVGGKLELQSMAIIPAIKQFCNSKFVFQLLKDMNW